MAPTTTTTPPVRRSARVASRAAAGAESTALLAAAAANNTKKPTKTTTTTAGKNSKKQKKNIKTHGHVMSGTAQKKQKFSGLKTTTVDSSAPSGVVDPAANITDGSITTLDGVPADAMLVLVDTERNFDKFFVLQCIKRGNGKHKYCVFSRWGRTGTVGQALLQDFDNAASAEQAFKAKFRQ
jgi:predicted DNA-binding WGR domain protein